MTYPVPGGAPGDTGKLALFAVFTREPTPPLNSAFWAHCGEGVYERGGQPSPP